MISQYLGSTAIGAEIEGDGAAEADNGAAVHGESNEFAQN